ncbi:MarR family transcriptional regulator [Campylobacter concisus]|uniref:MarR family transcriptional regulator n=1 Tax=Campylobacter concisus TaxID=199 RepID=UPI000CD8DD50|nr:MarR family transcriptional regulator [Campylobacter concisus]
MKKIHYKLIFSVLEILSSKNSLTRADICDHLKISKAYLSQIISNRYLIKNQIFQKRIKKWQKMQQLH